MYSHAVRNRAIELRKQGFAYNYISNELKVSKSALSDWLNAVEFLPNEITKQSILRGQKVITTAKRVDKARSLMQARKYADRVLGRMSIRDMMLIGAGIYIGEGSKTHNILRVVNADPRIIRFSLIWLKKCFGVPVKNFRVRLHIYPDTDQDGAVKFWMKQLDIPRSCFHECHVDRRSNKKLNKAGVLPYGTAHLGVKSGGNKDLGVLLHRKILATIDRVLDIKDMRD